MDMKYFKYDNYDAINVNKVKDIPMNFYGVMGVPVSFITKYDPKQFEILGCVEPCISLGKLKNKPGFKEYKSRQIIHKGIKCQKTYHRLLIKRK